MSADAGRKHRFARRRVRNGLWMIAVLILISCILWLQSQHLVRNAFTSGYILIAALLFLTSFNLRKKLTFLPQLGSSAAWMQLHIYVGLASVGVFFMHAGWGIPHGLLEQVLAGLYLFVAGSGVYGLYITRVVPRKLTQVPTEPLFESIPRLRKLLASEARQLMENQLHDNQVLRSVYESKLAEFFGGSRGWAYVLAPSSRYARQLVADIQKHDRYLTEHDQQHSRQLVQLVRERDDLDYHRAMQGRLKCWLIVHVACTYSLLLMSFVHGIMAHAFAGGLR